MGFFDRFRRVPDVEERYSFDDYASWMGINFPYNVPGALIQTWGSSEKSEQASTEYRGHAASMKTNGPVFTLMANRLRLFSQARWSYQRMRKGTPGDLFSTPQLDALNADPLLNQWMIRHADLGGNFYGRFDGTRVWPLRPDWVQVIAAAPLVDYDTEIMGYAFFPGGMNKTKLQDAILFPAEEVIHWAPEPDPDAKWRGMSWLSPVIREMTADTKMTITKEKFLDNGATPNMILHFDKDTSLENFEKFKSKFREEHEGSGNAYRTLFLGGGADATVVGANLQQLDFTAVQGKGETRLANAAGLHPVVIGFSEGMQGSSLNAGNFSQARRATADNLLAYLWASAAGAIGKVFPTPSDARLWFDVRDAPFLREDAINDATIKATDAGAIRQLIDAGYKPDAVIDAITSGDLKRLAGEHTDLFSVQLQPAGMDAASTPASSTGSRSTQLRLIRDENEFIQGAEWVEEA